MEIVKKHPNDRMKDVVKNYRGCGHIEYYGMLIWKNGLEFCRKCTYQRWQEESNYKWKPGENDLLFPLYEDGKNYYGGGEDEQAV